ncbi:MAG: hypothetical protein NTV93_12810 [Verrucomicrobia bacterium]|nr:hypothetical protein [Verrucomicrobiota bacterium]
MNTISTIGCNIDAAYDEAGRMQGAFGASLRMEVNMSVSRSGVMPKRQRGGHELTAFFGCC